MPIVSSGRAEVEDEIPIGLPRSSEFELPNAAYFKPELFGKMLDVREKWALAAALEKGDFEG